MEADDVLADQVDIGGPEAVIAVLVVGKTDPGHIGGERIYPDIHGGDPGPARPSRSWCATRSNP